MLMPFLFRNFWMLILSIPLFYACDTRTSTPEFKTYQAVYNRTEAELKIQLFEKSFYGKYKILYPGDAIDSGEVQGKIVNDTLIGDFYFTPYKWKHKTRRPFVLLKSGDRYIKGTGAETTYMGIPYYIPHTIQFEDAQFVFNPK